MCGTLCEKVGLARMIAQAIRRWPQRAVFSDFSDVRSCGLGTPADARVLLVANSKIAPDGLLC